MGSRSAFLDVDSTIIEKNLRITDDPSDEDFKNLLTGGPEYPSKTVKPFPGFCIKTKEVGTYIKIFVNICQTDAIPPPKDISDEELSELLDSDEPSSFRVPMSIGEIQMENDKKGNEAKKVDVAINPKFYAKVESSALFKSFFVAIAFEGISNKYNLLLTEDRIILQNRKAYGELQLHRIKQREIAEKMGIQEYPNQQQQSLMEGLTRAAPTSKAKPKIETLSSVTFDENENIQPNYRLFKKVGDSNHLIGEFKLPNVLDAGEITLDVGEDRIILESKTKKYFLDIFLPYSIDQNNVTSTFCKISKVLTVTMSLKLEE